MNKINNTLILFFLLTFIFFTLTTNTLGQTETNEKLKKKISDFVDIADKNFEKSHNRIERLSKKDGREKKEGFLFSLKDNKIEILTIEFVPLTFNDDSKMFRFKSTESYYFKDKKLVFALESVASNERNQTNWETIWAVYFSIHNGKVIDSSSVGHGKTEDDSWEPEPVKLSEKRLKQLQNQIKKIKF